MMSLYSLDILIDKEGNKFICELNGINSGLINDELEERAYSLLRERYPTITVNHGMYRWNLFKKKHPFRAFFRQLRNYFEEKGVVSFPPSILDSEKAYVDWLYQKIPGTSAISFPFDVYDGQESVVINSCNQELPHPLVNDYVAEEITRNKFYQYQLLKDTPVSKYLLPSALVGLGWGDEKELRALQEKHSFFIIKPIRGCAGRGVRVINKDGVEEVINTIGFVSDKIQPSFDELLVQFIRDTPSMLFLEQYADKSDLSFEKGMAIIQPFVRSTMIYEGEELYSSIRAIVCNNKFIDAYARLSPDPVSNIARSAIARHYEADGLPEFCEEVIAALKTVAGKCEFDSVRPDSFKQKIYNAYFDAKGRRKDVFGLTPTALCHYYIEMARRMETIDKK